MNVFSYIIGILIIIFAIAIILAVLLQEGRRAGVNGAISGAADTFLSKNKARSVDAFLSRWTKYITVAFIALVILVNIVALFVK